MMKSLDRIGLDENFISVIDDNGTKSFGGNQMWFGNKSRDSYIRAKGCGIISCLDTCLYLNGKSVITKSEYIDMVYQYISFSGVLLSGLSLRYGQTPFTMTGHIKRQPFHKNKVRWFWPSSEEVQYKEMKKMILNKIPVIWGLYSFDGKRINLYKYDDGVFTVANSVNDHYVTVTAICEVKTDNGIRRMIEVSSWGEKYYIDFDEYLEFRTTSFYWRRWVARLCNRIGSGIVIIDVN